MNFVAAEKIAAAVLYEGYILYPYRATSTKNVQRWNFGTLYPQEYAEAQCPTETFGLLTECLVESCATATFNIRVRFLQLVRRRAGTSQEWDEGIERSIEMSHVALKELQLRPIRHLFTFKVTDTVTTSETNAPAPQDISGELEIQVTELHDGLSKLSVELVNTTPATNASELTRKDAMLHGFVSAHILLGVTGGEFVSLLDTPEALREVAADCKNIGVFPVLVGEQG